MLVEPTRHLHVKGFNAVFFRREMPHIRNPGGLWQESHDIYSHFGGTPRESPVMDWRFPSGATIQMSHLELENTVNGWQGAQVCLFGFDELITFLASQFWFMFSRNRSMCGVRPYMRATTNPEADSWVAELIEWWIDQQTGYPIPERAGVIRWFVRMNDEIIWADKPQDLAGYLDAMGKPIPPKSFTFIPAKLEDNVKLMEADPGYMASLMALPTVDRERLLGGNWKIRPAAGMYFQRAWVGEPKPAAPNNIVKKVRGWDLAASEERPGTDPDWTVGVKLGVDGNGHYWVLDQVAVRRGPAGVEELLKATAQIDGRDTQIQIPQDPAQAGKSQKINLAKLLAGYNVRFKGISGDKIVRFGPFSAQAQAGNVSVVRGLWNERWFRELENFPPATKHGHDDDADATAEAFNALVAMRPSARAGAYEGM